MPVGVRLGQVLEQLKVFGRFQDIVCSSPKAEIVWSIAVKICDELQNTYLDVAKYPVGLESRINQVSRYLNEGPKDVRFIVICGMGGTGKTSLAKAVFNQLCYTFEAKSFLANIRENSEQLDGLVRLQKQLLNDILKTEKIDFVDRGISIIQERLTNKRVLVVLDDVSHWRQLDALAREREWFGSGSRIIITTRDVDSVKLINAEYVYALQPLEDHDSRQLFRLHAFGRCSHGEESFKLPEAVFDYCAGLPLALEVVGSYLFGTHPNDWNIELDRLRQSPHEDIQKKLEISYQMLKPKDDKELFLDVACFFVGWDKDLVIKILDHAGNLSTKQGLENLSKRSLVKITEDNRLEMHGMIQDMGREIVRKESHIPARRSRLFSHDEILSIFQTPQGTDEVKGLAYSPELVQEELTEVDAKAFENMRRLRLLSLNNVLIIGDYGLISKDLRWLRWHGFPLKSLPNEFCLENLVVLDLQYSKLKKNWNMSKSLGNLKVLNLCHSHFLTKISNFSNLQKLEELILEDCIELKEIDGSISCLEKLFLMNLQDCKKLESIPDSFCSLRSLRILDIRGCSKINRLPDDFGNLEALTEFLVDGAPIVQLPPSTINLKNLRKLSLCGVNESRSSFISTLFWSCLLKDEDPANHNRLVTSLHGLTSLTQLYLSDCMLSNDAVLEGIGSLRNLKSLSLTGIHFRRLPSSISSLCNLQSFKVLYCPMLESLPDMPLSVIHVAAIDCKSLERISMSNSQGAVSASFLRCPRLGEISHSGKWNPNAQLLLGGSKNLSTECKKSILQGWRGKRLCLPESRIPDWFEYQSWVIPYFDWDGELSFRLPACCSCELKEICISYALNVRGQEVAANPSHYYVSLIKDDGRKSTPKHRVYHSPDVDYIGVFSVSPSDIIRDVQYRGVEMTLDVDPSYHWVVKGIGVHLKVEYCPSCPPLVNIKDGDAKAGPSHACESPERRPENEQMAERAAKEKWLLKFSPE